MAAGLSNPLFHPARRPLKEWGLRPIPDEENGKDLPVPNKETIYDFSLTCFGH